MAARETGIPPLQLEDPDWYLGDPHATYRSLRRKAPVFWVEPHGFWFLTKYADVHAVSKDPGRFCSSRGFNIQEGLKPARPATADFPPTILAMDPPQHTKQRTLVSSFFTPRAVARLEARIRELARESIGEISPGETRDFVDAVSVRLPVLVIAEILGVPNSDREQFKAGSDALVALNDGDVDALPRVGELFAYMTAHALERRATPREDLLSALATGKPDGRLLEPRELGMFGMLLLAGGNETTRNLLSGGAAALMAHPDQLAQLADDPSRIPSAVEEMVRWLSPIRFFARTATRTTEIRGQKIAEGDFVVLCYSAANRDEDAYGPDSEYFDIHRKDGPPHLGFGVGQHVCIGAHLARLEARVVFEELLARFPRFELAGEIQRLRSILINGIERMPVTFHA
jgi:cytochrome P450